MIRFLALWLILVLLSWYPVQAARTFVVNTTALTVSSAIVSLPFSVCGWFKSSSTGADQVIFALGDSGATAQIHALEAAGTVASPVADPLRMRSRASTTTSASSTVSYTANVWQHGCGGVNASSTSRWVSLNGETKVTTSGTQVPTVNTSAIGYYPDLVPGSYFRGELEHVAVWNDELTQGEVNALAQGKNPHCIRPLNRVAYVPIWGDHSPELDLAGARTWTLVGTPAKAPGAPVGRFTDCAVGGG